MEKKKKQIGLLIDPELWWEFRTLAFEMKMTASRAAEEALKLYIKRARRRGKKKDEQRAIDTYTH